MEFVESSVFTARVVTLLTDEEYRDLQTKLVLHPKAGSVIPGAGGLRKLRWRVAGRGKRGGIRVIYYCVSVDRLYLIFVYEKTRQNDLTRKDVDILRRYVEGGVL